MEEFAIAAELELPVLPAGPVLLVFLRECGAEAECDPPTLCSFDVGVTAVMPDIVLRCNLDSWVLLTHSYDLSYIIFLLP